MKDMGGSLCLIKVRSTLHSSASFLLVSVSSGTSRTGNTPRNPYASLIGSMNEKNIQENQNFERMCLIANDYERIADEDVPCVKVLSYSDGWFYTPYKMRRVCDGVLNGRRLMRARGRECVDELGWDQFSVGRGFVHTFSTMESAKSLWFPLSGRVVYFDCVIPKGTRYWVSYDGMEYASKAIRFVKE